MTDRALILVVEKERAAESTINGALLTASYGTIRSGSGRDAPGLAAACLPDLILLDPDLPDMNGLQALSELRRLTETPVIIVSSKGEEHLKVEALDLGADDYVTRPFGAPELLARIRAALRRKTFHSLTEADKNKLLQVGGLIVDPRRRTVSVGGRDARLTPVEFRIVSLLAANAGRVLTHREIMREIWGTYAGSNQILRVNMANIRKKIEPDSANPRYIQTDSGVGYYINE